MERAGTFRRTVFDVFARAKPAVLAMAALAAATGFGGSSTQPRGPARDESPAPLSGAPLGRSTGLRLVVAARAPFLLDVDTGAVKRIAGVPALHGGVLWVVPVGGRGAAVVAPAAPRAEVYGVAGAGRRASALGFGTTVAPDEDGRTVWIQRTLARSRCVLRPMRLDGRPVGAARPFPCAAISPGGSLGLVVGRTRVVDPRTGRTVRRTRWGVVAAAGAKLVLAGPGRRFTLLDASTGRERRLRWPSVLAGMDAPAVDPRGRFVVLAFADPAWRGGGRQAIDLWLLDVRTGALTQVPGMPAFVSLKRTSVAWTADGRLVLLAESGRNELVGIWRPGRTRLALKIVGLPERSSGSDTFAPLG